MLVLRVCVGGARGSVVGSGVGGQQQQQQFASSFDTGLFSAIRSGGWIH
jgi:hypothetical protein